MNTSLAYIPQFEPSFDENEANALFQYMSSGGWVTEFKKTKEFEDILAQFLGAKHCVITNNGTVSLILALIAAGIKSGDEVLVPDLTMIATANACKIFGATPIFVDVEPTTLCMDLASAAAAVSSKTTALIYVSLHGRCGDIDKVKEFCSRHKLFFLEDAAQSLGSQHSKKYLGTYGDAGSFSFSMPKIITTGQGGALVTNDDVLAHNIKRLKDFGRISGGLDIHNSIGYNFKFTDIQAILGIEQMKKITKRISRKKQIYAIFERRLSKLDGLEMLPTDLQQTTPWFVDIYLAKPDALSEYLKTKGIGTRRIYPAIHTQAAYNISLDYQNALKAAKRGLWLPSSIQLTDTQINEISDHIIAFFKNQN